MRPLNKLFSEAELGLALHDECCFSLQNIQPIQLFNHLILYRLFIFFYIGLYIEEKKMVAYKMIIYLFMVVQGEAVWILL